MDGGSEQASKLLADHVDWTIFSKLIPLRSFNADEGNALDAPGGHESPERSKTCTHDKIHMFLKTHGEKRPRSPPIQQNTQCCNVCFSNKTTHRRDTKPPQRTFEGIKLARNMSPFLTDDAGRHIHPNSVPSFSLRPKVHLHRLPFLSGFDRQLRS